MECLRHRTSYSESNTRGREGVLGLGNWDNNPERQFARGFCRLHTPRLTPLSDR